MGNNGQAWKNLERRVRDELGEVFGYKFTRTANSGAGSTVKGDVIPEDVRLWDSFPYTVEVKLSRTRDTVTLENLLSGGKSFIFNWFHQAVQEAIEDDKIPVLVFRVGARSQIYAMVPYGDVVEHVNVIRHICVVVPKCDGYDWCGIYRVIVSLADDMFSVMKKRLDSGTEV